MATDEEIQKEAIKLHGTWLPCSDMTGINLLTDAIKKGIQMERERIRKNIIDDEFEISENNKDGFIRVIQHEDLDIWDDVD